jgi:hypothetical protein
MARSPTPALSRLALLLVPATLFVPPARAQSTGVNWVDYLHLTTSAEVARVENISRTSFEPTRKDATTLAVDVSSSLPRQFTPSVLFLGRGELSSLFVGDYELTNHVTVTGGLTLQKKFGLGSQAWVLQATVDGGYKAARLDDDQGFTAEAGLHLAKRVLPNLRLNGSVRWLEHDAESAVFDLNQFTYGLDAQWDINERWTLAGNASWLQGNIVANAAPAVWNQMLAGAFGSTIFNSYTSRPWSVTDLYGPGWVSYNVDGDVDLWSVTLTYAWTDHLAVDLRYNAAFVVNQVGVTYPSNAWALKLGYRF